METIEQRLDEIENRNSKVETDKAWETSWSRRLLIMLFTYLIIGYFMMINNIGQPWLNALVPTVGFMLSTLTMPFFRKLWIKHFKSQRK